MNTLFALSLLGASASLVHAGNLAVTFRDCGDSSTDAKVFDVAPKSIATGSTTTISGSGHLSKDVTGATYTMRMTGVGGMKLLECSGDASQAQECDIKAPLLGKVGSLAYQPLKFPIKAGDIAGIPQVATTLKSGLPGAFEATTTTLKVTGSNGDKVICVEIITKAASAVVPVVALPAIAPPVIASPLSNLAVSFRDCGDSSTDAKVFDVSPKSIATGSTTTISGSGHLSKDVTGATYTMRMTGVGGMKLLECSGDASQAQECDIKAPLLGKVGSLAYQPLKFPIKAGDIAGIPQVATTLKSGLPGAFEATTTTLKVTGSNGDKVICVEIMTKAAAAVVPVVALPAIASPVIASPLSNLAVSFEDCGDSSTDATVTDVSPKSIPTGSTTTISGTGHLSKDVTGATYTMMMTGVGGMKLLECSGDASQAQECDIKAPLLGKVGSLAYQPLKFPIEAGDISGIPQVATTLKSGLPGAFEATTTTLKVTGSNGDKVICVKIITQAAAAGQSIIV